MNDYWNRGKISYHKRGKGDNHQKQERNQILVYGFSLLRQCLIAVAAAAKTSSTAVAAATAAATAMTSSSAAVVAGEYYGVRKLEARKRKDFTAIKRKKRKERKRKRKRNEV